MIIVLKKYILVDDEFSLKGMIEKLEAVYELNVDVWDFRVQVCRKVVVKYKAKKV